MKLSVALTYKPGSWAHCKYCYTTHFNWSLGTDFGSEAVWVCMLCEHATKDEFMDVRTPEEVEEERQQAAEAQQEEIEAAEEEDEEPEEETEAPAGVPPAAPVPKKVRAALSKRGVL